MKGELLQLEAGQKLGGTDGFRGMFTQASGPGLMNAQTVAGLTEATISHVLEQGGDSNGVVVVAQDTRPHGIELRLAAIAAAQARGVQVIDLEVAPTPAAQKVAWSLGAIATFVLSASHNGPEDNGLKYMIGPNKPSGDEVRDISELYWKQQENGLVVPVIPTQGIAVSHDLLYGYEAAVVGDIREAFGDEAPLAGKTFVVDGANGAAMNLTPSIFKQLGARVEMFACDPKGVINDGCGAANLSGVKDFLRQRPDLISDPGFMGAVANDGDADRVMAVGVDVDGRLVDINGNHMLWALATTPKQLGIVGTEYTNSGLVERLEEESIDFNYCPNGDVYVTQGLLDRQRRGNSWTRGGEFTGHIIDTMWLNSGDGVHKAAWLAAWAAKRESTFGDLYRELSLWNEEMRRINFPRKDRETIRQHPDVQAALTRAQTQADARFILRPSGTEPVVRVWGESRDGQRLSRAVNDLAHVVTVIASAKE